MDLQTKEQDLLNKANALMAEAAQLATKEDASGEDIEKFHKMVEDVKAIKATNAQRQARRREINAKRLDNGCQHEFGSYIGGFPSNACTHCGLEREKPPGSCDHVWRISNDPIPTSYCEKCGKKYGGRIVEGSSSRV